ncbi:MAG: DUF6457 domain-containing protein [Pseudonocardiaceae bacterium]
MNTLTEWVELVCQELGVSDAVSPAAMQSRVLDMSRDVAHGVARPAAPITAYLLGLAAGRTTDPEAAAELLNQRVCQLAQSWADEHSGSPGPSSPGPKSPSE